MEIVTAKKEDLEIVRKITRSTIKSIYPRYYPAGAVEFFLAHHSDEHIVTDISENKIFVLYEGGEPVGTVTIKDNNINRLFVLPDYQHKRYGKALLDFAEKKILEVYTWLQIIQDPNHHLIVNEADGKIVSSCVCVIIPNLTRNVRPYAFIENVVTREDYRGKGYAAECLEFAREIAEKENCYKMMLLTGSKKPETLQFYEKCGYNSSDKTAFIQWLGMEK